jgi:phosphatidylinositol alpha-mannosyltransferase
MRHSPFKKIAIVTPYYYPLYGGVQEYVYHLKKEYKKMGYYVRVITGKFKNEPSKDENEVLRMGLGFPIKINGSVGRIIVIRRGEKVKQTLNNYNFDIIHLQEPFVPFLSHDVIKYSKAVNVATFHANFETNFFYKLGEAFLLPLWNKLSGRIAVSPSAKSSITKYFTGPIEIIPNGVDTSRFSSHAKKLEKFNDGKLNILFTGRIEKRKGLIYLLHAYKLLKEKYPEIRLIAVGKGPLLKDHIKYVKDNGLKDVHFEGFVSTEVLPSYYSTSHIYCSPALFGESFGIVLLEAMAASLPVVAFNISGYNDVVSNLNDGLLATPRDVHDLTEKLELLVTSAKLRRELGSNGLKKAKKYTWEIIAKRNIEYYKKLWENKK